MSIRDEAEKYIARGFAVCRLRPGDKMPDYKEWTLAGVRPEFFRDLDNIGLLTGRLNGDLVCVDLDGPEALAKADEFLPSTKMIDGRPGKPRAHRWYLVTDIPPEFVSRTAAGGMGGPRTKRFRHGQTNKSILDFQGTGALVVVPPSMHETGEMREWECKGEPATISMTELWQAVVALAKACGWKPREKQPAVKEPRPKTYPQTNPTPRRPLLPLTERIEKGKRFVEIAELASSGAGGHDTTFRIARYLRNDLALPEEEGRPLLGRYNTRLDEAGEETWSEEELDHKWGTAGDEDPNYPYGCKGMVEIKLPVSDCHRLAREFIANTPCQFWRDLHFVYDGRRYQMVMEGEIRAILNKHIRTCFDIDYAEKERLYQQNLKRYDEDRQNQQRPTAPSPLSVVAGLVTNVLGALEGDCLRRGDTSMPGWLGEEREGEWVSLQNGLLNLDSCNLEPHTPEWFSTVCLPYSYEPAAVCETWLKVLNQNLEGDTQRIAIVQEYFGYCLIKSTDIQICLMPTGDGNNGKSVLLAGLHAILGSDNVSAVPLEDFARPFAMAQTLGKLANIVAEIGEIDKTAEGTLKAFVSGDKMSFERKNKDGFAARPTARLVLATNNLPRLSDKSNGAWRRIIVMPFNRSVPDAERIIGMDKPEWWLRRGEVPGIFNWALEGLRRLQASHMKFTVSSVCKEALDRHRRDCDPVQQFLCDNYIAATNARPVLSADIYSSYKKWSEENGYKPVNATNLGRQIKRTFPEAESRNHRFPFGVCKAWFGIACYQMLPDVTGFWNIGNAVTGE